MSIVDTPAGRARLLDPLGILTPGSPEWQAQRLSGIGGSEVASVLGVQAPWAPSPFTLWHIKAGNIDGSVADSDPMYWGRVLEPVIVAEYARRHPDDVVDHIGDRMHRRRDRPFQIVSPDALARTGTATRRLELVEAKAPGRVLADVPLYYELQARWYLDALGLEHATLAALAGGQQWQELEVVEDLIEQADTRAAVAAFMQSVRDGRQPRIDDTPSTYDTLQELSPTGDDDTTARVDERVARDYLTAITAAEDVAMQLQGAKNRLRAAMGDAKRAKCGPWPIATVRSDGALIASPRRPRPDQIGSTTR